MERDRRVRDILSESYGFSEAFRARFEVLGEIARGGMGVVLRARDRADQRDLAIKLLFSGAAADNARFKREAAVLQSFQHPNIVRLYGSGADGRRPYLFMELIEGAPLRPEDFRGPDGAIDFEALVRIFAIVADALAACHAAGLVHRDIKPGNILVEAATRRPVLVDFGLVKVHEQHRSIPGATIAVTSTGELIGTPAYMAPEQFCPGEFGEVGPATDVWGMAASLFFLITGRPIYPGDHLISIVAAVMREDPPPLSSLEPSTPAWLDELLASCLQREPEARPDIRTLADGLDARGQSHALGRALVSSIEVRRQRKRRWILVCALVLAILMLVTGGLLWEQQRQESARLAAAQRRSAEAVRAVEQSLAEGEGFGEAAELEARISEASAALAALVARDRGARLRLALARALLAKRQGRAFAPPAASARPSSDTEARLLSWSEGLRPRPPSLEALREIDVCLRKAREGKAYFALDLALAKLRMQVALGRAREAARAASRSRLFERLPPKVLAELWPRSVEASAVLAFLRQLSGDRSQAARALERAAWEELERRDGLLLSSERDRQNLFESLETFGPWPRASERDLALLRVLLESAERSDKGETPMAVRPGDRPAAALAALLASAPELGSRPQFKAALEVLEATLDRRFAEASTLQTLNFARSAQVMEPKEEALLQRCFDLNAAAAAAAESGGQLAFARRFQGALADLLVNVAGFLRGRARTGDRRESLMGRLGDMGLALPLDELPASKIDYPFEFWDMKAEGMRAELREPGSPERLAEIREVLQRAVEAQGSKERRVAIRRRFLASFLYTKRNDLIVGGLPSMSPEEKAAAPNDAAWVLACQGQFSNMMGQHRDAIALLSDALDLAVSAGEDWHPYFHKAMAHGLLEELDAASATLDRAGREKSFGRVFEWVQLLGLAQQLDEKRSPGGSVARMTEAIARRSASLVGTQERERSAISLLMGRALLRMQAGDRGGALAYLKQMAEKCAKLSGVPERLRRSLVRRVKSFRDKVEAGANSGLGDIVLRVFGSGRRRSDRR